MAYDVLSDLDTFAWKYVCPSVVDNVFKADPLLAYLYKNVVEPFEGGTLIQENFRYDGMNGAAYAEGEDFDISEKQTDSGMQFDPKTYYVDVTESLRKIRVFLRASPQTMFNKVEADLNNASDTMAANLAISLYQNGIRTGFTKMINGLAEICNDNATNSWDSQQYAVYGSVNRGGVVSPALNAAVTDINRAIIYNDLEISYNKVVIGNEHPTIGVTTNNLMSSIRIRFHPLQKVEGQEPVIGFTGIKFNQATILQSQYCPGAAISGTTDKIVTNFMKKMNLTYPTLSGNAEAFFWLTVRYSTGDPVLKLYVSPDELYQFGWTGFKRAQNNDRVAGQYLFAGNVVCRSPRLQHQLTRGA